MIAIPGYQAIEKLYESSRSLIYRAQRSIDRTPVILKMLREEYPSPQAIARFQMEYDILRSLNLVGVVTAYGLETFQQSYFIVLEDCAGKSLRSWLSDRIFNLEEFLNIAIQLTSILGEIHQHNIIHKDINPSNILLNPNTGQVKIADFGLATVLSRENPTWSNPHVLEGTLAYMSPEQTGRMNRTIDYRTDFYSLGVTFYQLLCDRLPFTTTDALELVHCHIARRPISPHEIDAAIPRPLSDLVMKLLAKTAEDRYQTTLGIQADLQACLSQIQQGQEIAYFEIGRGDISSILQIPQKTYGREREVVQLSTALKRVAIEHPQSELILISGYSGIGKTTLVRELYKPITRQRGYFITGKFEQLQRNLPYSAVIQAFRSLIRQLLTETIAQIQQWRSLLLAALGDNARVAIDIIPDLELLIGYQAKPIELPPAELQNRFHRVLEKFIGVFTQPDINGDRQTICPLVIFLDDLQWADRASLQLIEQWITGFNDRHLLVIGAYRNNEVDAAHPLIRSIFEIQRSGGTVHQIELPPLGLADIHSLIRDTFHCDSESSLALAELTLEKTNGNPFFVNELLRYLERDGSISFDLTQGKWQWDLERIQTARLADNVVELVTVRFQQLSIETQNVLSLAACIGSQFDLQTLAIVNDQLTANGSGLLRETANALGIAARENLIIPLGDNYKYLDANARFADLDFDVSYQFLHDRIQQAAYSLISVDRQMQCHLEIGRYLQRSIPVEQLEDRIFDVIDHLNFGAKLIVDRTQKKELAQLNLMAGRKAKTAIAYEPAVRYLTTGLQLLAKSSWQTDYELTLALYTEATEAEFLNLNFGKAKQLADRTIHQAKSLLDSIRVYEIQMQFYARQNQLQSTLDLGLQLLEMLDIPLSGSTVDDNIQPEELTHLPLMTDPAKLAAMRILFSLAPAAYVIAPDLFAQMSNSSINLCRQYGNSPLATVAYGFRGLMLCATPDHVELGYRFAQLALQLLERFDAKEFKSHIYVIFNGHIRHWREHLKQTIPALLEGLQSGLETGSLEYAGYNALYFCDHLFFTGEPLAIVVEQQTQQLESMLKLRQDAHISYLKIWRILVLKLLDVPPTDWQFRGEALNEAELLNWSIAADKQMFVFAAYLSRTIWFYTIQDYQQAIDSARLATEYQSGVVGLVIDAEHTFYYALALLAQTSEHPQLRQSQSLVVIAKHQEKLRQWSIHAPMNYLHKFHLVEAEHYRILGRDIEAADAYDLAIDLAQTHEYLHEEALANELAGKFYLNKGKPKIARSYLFDARYCYLRWGAIAKVNDLDRRYPQFLDRSPERIATVTNSQPSTSTTSSNETATLDLAALMKASQALSGEIMLDKLVGKLMTTLMENSGAQRGCLLLDRHDQLHLAAAADSEQSGESVLLSIPLNLETAQDRVALAIINYVARTQENIVLDRASQDYRFNQDPYILKHQPKSILCTPLTYQGKRFGILYLENNLTTDAFTPERLEILQFLSTQAAISLDNAQLYNQLELRVQERTLELTQTNDLLQAEVLERQRSEQTLRLIVEGTAAVTGADFFRSLVQSLAQALGVRYAFISECLDALPIRVRSFVFWQGTEFGKEFEYDLAGTPCERVIESGGFKCFPSQIQALFPKEKEEFEAMEAQSYAGIALLGSTGNMLGHLAILDDKPMKMESRIQAILEIFAARAAAEMERQQSENALQVSETKFATAFRSSPDAITISTLNDGCYIEVNESCLQMLGYRREEILGHSSLELGIWANPTDRETIQQQLQSQDKVTNQEIELRRKSGEIFPALFSAEAIQLEDEPCILSVAADITLLKQAEKALARLAEIGELAATIVHEVRNPLTTILMGLNAFKKLQLADQFQEYLTLSLDEADRLQRLLSQILLYSKPQILDRSPIELNSFVAEIVTTLQTIPAASGKQLEFAAFAEPVHVLADKDKLKQVIINLVTNAYEAVDTGDVVTIDIQSSENHRICIQIHNGGTPIPANVLPQLTKPFFTTKASGTGLGLAIVKRIVEAHGGEFSIESGEGIGSIVRVQLPIRSI
jgi:PAS domain S-box-containing protein